MKSKIATLQSVYLNLLANNQSSYANGSPIKFDIITDKSNNISYDSGASTITILENGIYYVNWWISLTQPADVRSTSFSLQNQNNDSLSFAGFNTFNVGLSTIFGVDIFSASRNDKLQLINTSSGQISLRDQQGSSGSLSMFRVSGGA